MEGAEVNSLLDQLEACPSRLHQRDFILTWDHSLADVQAILLTARTLESMWTANVSTRLFRGGLAVSIFRDQSTRTRFSFASAASLLGLTVQDFDESRSQIAHGETVRETATMISFLTEVIGIRDDLFIDIGHAYQQEVSQALADGLRDEVLPQKPTVINLQSDRDHPTQTLADLAHLEQTFGSLEALRGKKLAMAWAYSPSYGKPLSVAQGVTALMTRFGMNVVLAHPEGYDILPDVVERAGHHAGESGGSFRVVHDMGAAFDGADVVYPKSWAPYAIMRERTDLLQRGATGELEALEQRCLELNARHKDWECDAAMMSRTRHGDGLYLHCLPADITSVSCAAGEVSADVFERFRIQTYRQAGHKPFVIAAIILLTRFANVASVLRPVDTPKVATGELARIFHQSFRSAGVFFVWLRQRHRFFLDVFMNTPAKKPAPLPRQPENPPR